MNTTPAVNRGISMRSMGVKLIVVCLLAVLMNIPGLFVQGLVSDRMVNVTRYAPNSNVVLNEVAVTPYRSVDRSLKYILLFEGLVFLSYFSFEVTSRKRMHPAQYVLVGVAQVIFYLLLLSFTEKIGFDYAFLVAGAATVALLSANAAWIFENTAQGMRALAVFAPLYGFIYILLRMKDYALLVGAIASFAAVAIVMYLTRSLDWYSSLAFQSNGEATVGAAQQTPVSGSGPGHHVGGGGWLD